MDWMGAGCLLNDEPGRWVVTGKEGGGLAIDVEEILRDTSFDLGVDPGLRKDGVESHLQELLAAQVHLLGEGWRLVRREYPTAIGPVDLMCRDSAGASVAIEIKHRGEIDGADLHEGTAAPKPRHWAVEVNRPPGIDAVDHLSPYLNPLTPHPLPHPSAGA